MSDMALIPEIVGMDVPLVVAPRTGELLVDEPDKNLVRMVRLWEKLGERERKAFRRYIDGMGEIDTAGQLVGAAEAARILHTTFYEVKRMAREGILKPVTVKAQTDYWERKDGDSNAYRFRRADVVALAASDGN